MRIATKLACAAVCVLLCAPGLTVSQDTQKTEAIRTLLRANKAGELGAQMMTQMIETFRTTVPDVPQEFWDQLQLELNPDELTDLIVPIYDRHFTQEDINQLIAFHESPIGKKFVELTPTIFKESQEAGQKWAEAMLMRVMEKMPKQEAEQ